MFITKFFRQNGIPKRLILTFWNGFSLNHYSSLFGHANPLRWFCFTFKFACYLSSRVFIAFISYFYFFSTLLCLDIVFSTCVLFSLCSFGLIVHSVTFAKSSELCCGWKDFKTWSMVEPFIIFKSWSLVEINECGSNEIDHQNIILTNDFGIQCFYWSPSINC